jgi:hypothetical protein
LKLLTVYQYLSYLQLYPFSKASPDINGFKRFRTPSFLKNEKLRLDKKEIIDIPLNSSRISQTIVI